MSNLGEGAFVSSTICLLDVYNYKNDKAGIEMLFIQETPWSKTIVLLNVSLFFK